MSIVEENSLNFASSINTQILISIKNYCSRVKETRTTFPISSNFMVALIEQAIAKLAWFPSRWDKIDKKTFAIKLFLDFLFPFYVLITTTEAEEEGGELQTLSKALLLVIQATHSTKLDSLKKFPRVSFMVMPT